MDWNIGSEPATDNQVRTLHKIFGQEKTILHQMFKNIIVEDADHMIKSCLAAKVKSSPNTQTTGEENEATTN